MKDSGNSSHSNSSLTNFKINSNNYSNMIEKEVENNYSFKKTGHEHDIKKQMDTNSTNIQETDAFSHFPNNNAYIEQKSQHHNSHKKILGILNSKASFGCNDSQINSMIKPITHLENKHTNVFSNSDPSESSQIKEILSSNQQSTANFEEGSKKNWYNSLIQSNEQALKDIIQTFDLKIEDSFGSRQIKKFKNKNNQKKENYEKEKELEIIPEKQIKSLHSSISSSLSQTEQAIDEEIKKATGGSLNNDKNFNFTLKSYKSDLDGQKIISECSSSLKNEAIQDNQIYSKEKLKLLKQMKLNNNSQVENMMMSDSSVNLGESVVSHKQVNVLMNQLEKFMMESESNINFSNFIKNLELDEESKNFIQIIFEKQNKKLFEQNQHIKTKYEMLQKEKDSYMHKYKELESSYKAKIEYLEHELASKNLMIDQLKVKPKSQQRRKNGLNVSKESIKFNKEKVKQLDKSLKEKNIKLDFMENLVDELKIENEALKELLSEFSN